MNKKKEVTNEQLLKKIEDLEKKIEEQKPIVLQPIPYMPAPIVVQPCHHHCNCWQCNPHPYHPYTIMGIYSQQQGVQSAIQPQINISNPVMSMGDGVPSQLNSNLQGLLNG